MLDEFGLIERYFARPTRRAASASPTSEWQTAPGTAAHAQRVALDTAVTTQRVALDGLANAQRMALGVGDD